MSVANLDNQLCFALYSASNHLTKIYRPILDSLDLTYTQFIVLMALWEKDNISISVLANRVRIGKATMTPLLKKLEKKGLIVKQVQVDNERQKNIVLTKTGHDLSLKSKQITEQAFCATGLSRSQASNIIDLCHKIVQPYVKG